MHAKIRSSETWMLFSSTSMTHDSHYAVCYRKAIPTHADIACIANILVLLMYSLRV